MVALKRRECRTRERRERDGMKERGDERLKREKRRRRYLGIKYNFYV